MPEDSQTHTQAWLVVETCGWATLDLNVGREGTTSTGCALTLSWGVAFILLGLGFITISVKTDRGYILTPGTACELTVPLFFILLLQWGSGIKIFFGSCSFFSLCFCVLFSCHCILIADAKGRGRAVVPQNTDSDINYSCEVTGHSQYHKPAIPVVLSEPHRVSTCWIKR